MTPPLFLAGRDQLAADRVVLGGAEGRHAATVRRLRPGEQVEVTDGGGLLAACVVVGTGRDTVELEITSRRQEPAATPRLVVVQALPKGDRGELAVEMMTEAGVDTIVPWAAARCVAAWRAERGAKALARWRSTAREAAKQARRPWLPEVTELAGTERVAERIAGAAVAVVLHEVAATPLSGLDIPGPGEAAGEIVVVVGPEGGITDDELAAFTSAGGVPVRLGPTVLRTSTAGVAAAAILLGRCGRW